MTPKLLIYDGLDRVGKTTTIRKVWKERGCIDSCIDRGILSNIVYNDYYARDINREDYLDMMNDSESIVYIYMHADTKVIKQRAADSKDDAYTIDELERQKRMFEKSFEWLSEQYENIKFVSIDANGTQDEVVNAILKEIE